LELIDLTLTLASCLAQRFKQALAVPRPHHINARIFPALLTPGHASLPSGHSTEAFAVSRMLCNVLGAKDGSALAKTLLRLAASIAENRQVAGLHYPMDSTAGSLLGIVVADFLTARMGSGALRSPSSFTMGAADPDAPFDPSGTVLLETGMRPGASLGEERAGAACPTDDRLRWLFDEVRKEWGIPAGAPGSGSGSGSGKTAA
jgi:acid phosphatase family membrane protein YuiD